MDITSYFNNNSVPPKELPQHDYKWDIQKNEDTRT